MSASGEHLENGRTWQKRLRDFYIGPHSYDIQDTYQDVLENVYIRSPPKHGQTREEYFEDVSRLVDRRYDRLDVPEYGIVQKLYAPIRQGDESLYVLYRGGMVLGGMSILSHAVPQLGDVSTVTDLIPYGETILGGVTVAGAPTGVMDSIREINAFADEMPRQRDLYQAARNALDHFGPEILPEEMDEKVFTPQGVKHVEFALVDGRYVREK